MNIGVFSDSYKPYISGVVRSIDIFGRELTELGHNVYIFAPGYRGYKESDPKVFRFASIQSPSNRDFSLGIPIAPTLGRRMKDLKLDIVHVHSPFLIGGMGARAARRCGIPLVFTYHTLYEEYVHYVPVARGAAKAFIRGFSRYFCNRCDRVIAPTGVVKELLMKYGVKSPIEVLPTGIDYPRFSSGDPNWLRDAYGIHPERKLLLFVGRLGKEKNLDFLLRAFARINREVPESMMVLVAGGPEEENLKALSGELGISGNVLFTGPIHPDKVADAYAGADIFAFASVTETQGVVLLEAMAAGLPVVAVNAYGSSNMITDGEDGILTPPDIRDFADAVVRVLKSGSLKERLSSGAKIKAQRMSSANMAVKLESIYLELARR